LNKKYYHYNPELDIFGLMGSVPPPHYKAIMLSHIDINHTPYITYKGDNYLLGDQYEFSDNEQDWVEFTLTGFTLDSNTRYNFRTPVAYYKNIRKIDRVANYKKRIAKLKLD